MFPTIELRLEQLDQQNFLWQYVHFLEGLLNLTSKKYTEEDYGEENYENSDMYNTEEAKDRQLLVEEIIDDLR